MTAAYDKIRPRRVSPRASAYRKGLAEFAARRRQKMGIIFHRDMCVGEKIHLRLQ